MKFSSPCHSPQAVAAAFLLATLGSCIFPPGEQWTGNRKLPLEQLDYPGFFDVGVGFGVASNDLESTEGGGVVLSLRAYPTGRWYSTQATTATRANKVLKNLLSQAIGKRTILTPEQILGDDAVEYYALVLGGEGTVAERVTLSRKGPRPLKGGALESPAARNLHLVPEKDLVDFLAALTKQLTPAFKEDTSVPKAAVKAVTDLGLANLEDEVKALRASIEKAVEEAQLEDAAKVMNVAMATPSTFREKEWFVVADRDHWYHRLAVFYGRSVVDFAGSLDSDGDIVGVSYDIAPQFSIMAGWGFFDGEDDQTSRYFIGTSLNLNAFKEFFGSVLGQD